MSPDTPSAAAIWADIRAAYRVIEDRRRSCADVTNGHPTKLRELLKRHYETGDYGRTHLAVCFTDWDLLQRAEPRPPWEPARVVDVLMGIPVAVDESIPLNRWELRDTAGNLVTAGVIDEEPQP